MFQLARGSHGHSNEWSSTAHTYPHQPQERDPRRLLQPLTATLAARGLALPLALFVPADSSYAKLAPRGGPPDVAWQAALQQVWEAEFAAAARLQARPTAASGSESG